jgi:hypothetical protein
LRFLACRTFTAAGSGDDAVEWLLSDERNFRLSWADSPRWASRELIEVATRHCDDGHLQALAQRLMEHYPPWEKSAERRQLYGRAQYELLSAVEPSRRNAGVTRRIGELERKCAGWPLTGPRAAEAHFVGSPKPDNRAGFLTDDDWIRAIRKHRSDKTDWSGDRPVGSANELANLLGARAKDEPERFARLALTFDAETPAIYFNRVIDAVPGDVPIELLAELCCCARDVAGQSVRRSICHALESVGADANDTLFIGLDDSKRLLPAALCRRANGPSRSPAANSATSARRVPQ